MSNYFDHLFMIVQFIACGTGFGEPAGREQLPLCRKSGGELKKDEARPLGWSVLCVFFNALSLLGQWKEGHPVHKNDLCCHYLQRLFCRTNIGRIQSGSRLTQIYRNMVITTGVVEV